jgi:hypothetical protein
MARIGRSFPTHTYIAPPIALNSSFTTFQGSATLSGTGGLTAGGNQGFTSAATMSATAGMTNAGSYNPQGSVDMSAVSILSDNATQQSFGSVAMTATAALSSTVTGVPLGTSTLTATGALTAGAAATRFSAAAMNASAAMTVSLNAAIGVSSSLSAVGSLSVTAVGITFGVSSLDAAASLSTTAVATGKSSVTFSAIGSLTSSPLAAFFSQVDMSATGSVVVAIDLALTGTATLGATAGLTVSAHWMGMASATLSAVSAMTASILTHSGTESLLSAISTLIADSSVLSGPIQNQPYYLREYQDWAVQQERQRHAQAIYMVGEQAIFVLMWHLLDFEAGLVQRCHTCYDTTNVLTNRISAVYNQPHINKCPDCFGTTFEGGYRARIIRPVIFTDTDESEKPDRRGTVHQDDVNVESTWDFRSREGDYLLRSDGSRWRLGGPQRVTLRTGFSHPGQGVAALGYSNMRASYEETTTVAYMLPPLSKSDINSVLTAPAQFPPDFSSFEIIRAPLIPSSIED